MAMEQGLYLYGASSSNPSKRTKTRHNHHHFMQQEMGFHERIDLRDSLIRWRSGKSVDSRLLTLLEFFRELYMERREFFKKIFPGIYDEFAELYQKFGGVLSWSNGMKPAQTMQRSLSFGEESTSRLERFKVRTPAVLNGGVQQGSQSGQGDTNSIGSK